jgi:leukotriene-A4 hydrolase
MVTMRRFVLVPSALALGLAVMAAAPPGPSPSDVHSFSRPDEVRVTHLDLDWNVSFEKKMLEGVATLTVARQPGAEGRPLILDTRALDIRAVSAAHGEATGGAAGSTVGAAAFHDAPWKFGATDVNLGRPLIIDLPDNANLVRVTYATSPDATGPQWLDPAQTAGKKYPFLYTQSEAIDARSWIPCQDSPAVRVTYEARVHVRAPLRAVMAAEDITPTAAGKPDTLAGSGGGAGGGDLATYTFRMTRAIPSYLIALGVGDLQFRAIGPRTGVWSEPSVVEKAAWEFADMEKMLIAAERLFGPYRWERYDVLVLPPSFPFGGMENPRLTFATPTVLAGDRSLVALVSHEMAHSWSGNLVTNATWSDFWLNEGFTTYIERRIQEEVYGRERAEMEATLGRQDLREELDAHAKTPGDQVLHIDLKGRNPDDGMNTIPYEKGCLFLRLLEETYGRPVFDVFLRAWFDEHAFTSVTTGDFVAFLEARLISGHTPLPGRKIPDVQAWVSQPGLPADAPTPHSDALDKVAASAAAWAEGKVALGGIDTSKWTTQHWLHFLKALPDKLSREQMAALDKAYSFTRTGNSEILDDWLVLAVRHHYDVANARLEEFLTSQGRRKYLKPLYQELVKTPEGKASATRIYAKGRPLYHAISRHTLDEIVGYTPPAA